MDRENTNELDPAVTFRRAFTEIDQLEESLFDGRLDLKGEYDQNTPRNFAKKYLEASLTYHAPENEKFRRELGADDLAEKSSDDLYRLANDALEDVKIHNDYFPTTLFFSSVALDYLRHNDHLSPDDRRHGAVKLYEFGSALEKNPID